MCLMASMGSKETVYEDAFLGDKAFFFLKEQELSFAALEMQLS